MTRASPISIVGGGIAGLATALALGRGDVPVHLFERANAFSEVGAGIGLGPNATRVLRAWGLTPQLDESGCTPDSLLARDAVDGRVYGRLQMGQAFIEKYGAPYVTIHRADLHRLLLEAVQLQATCELHLNQALTGLMESPKSVTLTFNHASSSHETQALVGADGLQSVVRQWMADASEAQPTGHWAYRALLRTSDLPLALRGSHLGIWMGRHLHVVHYPVKSGQFLNLVVLLASPATQAQPGWDLALNPSQIASDLRVALRGCAAQLQDLIQAASDWRAWCLFDRPPLRQADQMAQGRLVLVGDAAHPMLPYLAQGAGMALEDAASLAAHWQHEDMSIQQRLLQFAQTRWQRVSRVQQRAQRNGVIFHAHGALRLARNTALKVGGSRLMDMPWLYSA